MLPLLGIILLAIPMGIITLMIKWDDSGPVIFKQKRVGKGKSYFNLYKFRPMKLSTPHDVPTHQLENPKQYLLKMGEKMRKYSFSISLPEK